MSAAAHGLDGRVVGIDPGDPRGDRTVELVADGDGYRVVDLDAPTPEPTVTIPAARYAEMLRAHDELTESRDHAVSTGLDALDRVRTLEERVRELEGLLAHGTSKARAIAVLRAEGIEPVPADEVRAMREAVSQLRHEARSRTDGQRVLGDLARIAGLSDWGGLARWVEESRQMREDADAADAALPAEVARLREDLSAWQLSNVPRLLGLADDQLAAVRAVLDCLRGLVPNRASELGRALAPWQAAGCPLTTEADRG